MIENKSLTSPKNLPPQKHLLNQLSDEGLRYALMREPEKWRDSGDIDIIVSDFDHLVSISQSLGLIEISASAGNRKYIRYDGKSRTWLHLDVISKFIFGVIEAPVGFVGLLLDRAETGSDGIPRLTSSDEAVLLILHAVLEKRVFTEKHIRTLVSIDMKLLHDADALFSFLPRPPSEYIELIEQLRKDKITPTKATEVISVDFGSADRVREPLMSRAHRRIKHFFKSNEAIVFLGPDGAGKSTLTKSLAVLRWPRIRRQFMGPARKSAMRRYLFYVQKLTGNARDKNRKFSPMGLIARGIWQVVCYVDFLERLYRQKWHWGSGGVTIFDRYACDMFIRKPSKLNDLLFIKMFPRPKFVFLCIGDPGIISRRKPELTEDEVTEAIGLYRQKLAESGIPFLEIDTTSNTAEININYVVSYLVSQAWFKK